MWKLLILFLTSMSFALVGGAPHKKLLRMGSDIVDNQYLVVFKSDIFDVDAKANELVRSTRCDVKFTYNITIKGFAVGNCAQDDLHLILDDDKIELAIEVSSESIF
jgi:hypothetical protein